MLQITDSDACELKHEGQWPVKAKNSQIESEDTKKKKKIIKIYWKYASLCRDALRKKLDLAENRPK